MLRFTHFCGNILAKKSCCAEIYRLLGLWAAVAKAAGRVKKMLKSFLAPVLLSASIERFFVSHMRNFFLHALYFSLSGLCGSSVEPEHSGISKNPFFSLWIFLKFPIEIRIYSQHLLVSQSLSSNDICQDKKKKKPMFKDMLMLL